MRNPISRRRFLAASSLAIASPALAMRNQFRLQSGGAFAPIREFNVILSAGQSNCVGTSTDGTTLTSAVNDPWISFNYLAGTWPTGWVYADSGFPVGMEFDSLGSRETFSSAPGFGGFGPERGFARTATLQNIAVIKFAVNGTSIGATWKKTGTWNPAYYCMLDHFRRGLAELRSNGNTATVRAMIWTQGESDAGFEVHATPYEANMQEFATNVRADLSEGTFPWVAMRLASWLDAPYLSTVRAAQENLVGVIPSFGLADADDLAHQTDNVHLTSASKETLGIRMHTKWLEIQ